MLAQSKEVKTVELCKTENTHCHVTSVADEDLSGKSSRLILPDFEEINQILKDRRSNQNI
jgi:hypothetical protein